MTAIFTGAERFDAVATFAKLLCDDGVPLSEAVGRLATWNGEFCDPPLGEDALGEALNGAYFDSAPTQTQTTPKERKARASTHKIAALSLRVTPIVKDAAARAAAAEGRSVASWTERTLAAHLKSLGYLGDAE
jgi:hypothetical protein